MSVPEAAVWLGVDPSTVYKLIRLKKLPAEELPFIRRNRFRIKLEDLQRLRAGE